MPGSGRVLATRTELPVLTMCRADAAAKLRPMTIASAPHRGTAPAELTDRELLQDVTSPLARCTGGAIDPDDWFPVTADMQKARAQAARAIALCAVCPVRAECLELSLRHWQGAGRHGVWGGLVEAERSMLRPQWLAGVAVAALLPVRDDRERREQDRFLRGEHGRDQHPRGGHPRGGHLRRERPATYVPAGKPAAVSAGKPAAAGAPLAGQIGHPGAA